EAGLHKLTGCQGTGIQLCQQLRDGNGMHERMSRDSEAAGGRRDKTETLQAD
ncbi:MAG: hypothetical protein RLZZ536_1777, partial [Planctomycetota bacterium]